MRSRAERIGIRHLYRQKESSRPGSCRPACRKLHAYTDADTVAYTDANAYFYADADTVADTCSYAYTCPNADTVAYAKANAYAQSH